MSEALTLARPDLIRDAAYIDGRWMRGEQELTVVNPATSQSLARVPDLGMAHALQAVAAAEEQLPAWRALAATQRALLLRRWYELIVLHLDDLARLHHLGIPLVFEHGRRTEKDAEADRAEVQGQP